MPDHDGAPDEPDAGDATGDELPDVSPSPGELQPAKWNALDWHGKMLLDSDGSKIGKLRDVYVDVETDEPQFATVREGLFARHLTFVPLAGVQVEPSGLRVLASKAQVRSAQSIALHGEELTQSDESALYHNFEMNYTAPETASGRRLARR